MQDIQNIPNPDINSVGANEDFGNHGDVEQSPDTDDRQIQKGYGKDLPPVVPPDQQPVVPIEDPPGSNEPPVGDVDDSPARIAGT